MKPIVGYLGEKKDYLCGELTFIDFYFLELCDFVQFLTENKFYSENKSIARYVMKMKGIK